ncbi:MAG TPA: hypothetical protein PKV16_01815 [Caldisericia bacterium]|nr:hypothetical protein [Caldisericia bacterium]HPF48860.1 hypothetical protein [Caldisericia bacterium]HPI83276.1 hypothetical protein [Caldisericia bacterium]HPQ92503.1 hypothetical protein [Caldisericia bacterium]HRV74399.1 hypothetical protein [Caldisericia bacterium]
MTDMPDEAEFVIDILKGRGKLSTTEIETEIKSQGIACNDAAAQFLPNLRAQGFINGEFKKGVWYWWVDEG